MPVSFERTYYRSEAFKVRREEMESEIAYKRAVLERLGQVITVTAGARR